MAYVTIKGSGLFPHPDFLLHSGNLFMMFKNSKILSYQKTEMSHAHVIKSTEMVLIVSLRGNRGSIQKQLKEH